MSKIFPHFRMKLPKSLSSSFNVLTVWAPRGGWVVWLCAVTVRGASRITYCIVQQLAAADPSLSNHFLSIHTLIILLLSPLHPGSASWFYQVGMLTVGLAGGLGIPSLVWPFQRQNVALASAATEHSSVGEVAQLVSECGRVFISRLQCEWCWLERSVRSVWAWR